MGQRATGAGYLSRHHDLAERYGLEIKLPDFHGAYVSFDEEAFRQHYGTTAWNTLVYGRVDSNLLRDALAHYRSAIVKLLELPEAQVEDIHE